MKARHGRTYNLHQSLSLCKPAHHKQITAYPVSKKETPSVTQPNISSDHPHPTYLIAKSKSFLAFSLDIPYYIIKHLQCNKQASCDTNIDHQGDDLVMAIIISYTQGRVFQLSSSNSLQTC